MNTLSKPASPQSDELVESKTPVEAVVPLEPTVVESVSGDVRQQIDLTAVGGSDEERAEDSDVAQRLIDSVQRLIKIAFEHIDTTNKEINNMDSLAQYEKIYPSLFREKYNSARARIVNTHYGKAFTCLREALWDISYLATDEAQSIKNQIAQDYNRFVSLYEKDIRWQAGSTYSPDLIKPKRERYLFLVSYANQKRDTPCNSEDASIIVTKQFLDHLLKGWDDRNEVWDGHDPVETAYDLLRETKASNSSTAQLLIRQRAVEYLESRGMGASEKEIDKFKKSHPSVLKNINI